MDQDVGRQGKGVFIVIMSDRETRRADGVKLLRNYTQNIDTLESLAGVQNVLQCHGMSTPPWSLQYWKLTPSRLIQDCVMSGRRSILQA